MAVWGTLIPVIVGAAIGGGFSLAITTLTMRDARAREQRDYARKWQETRYQLYQAEYLSALEVINSALISAAVFRAADFPASASNAEITERLSQPLTRLVVTKSRLSILPAPVDITGKVIDISNALSEFISIYGKYSEQNNALSGADLSTRINNLEAMERTIAFNMQSHLLEMRLGITEWKPPKPGRRGLVDRVPFRRLVGIFHKARP